MIDRQKAIEEIIAGLEDVILNADNKRDAEDEGITFLDKYRAIDIGNKGYLQCRLRYLLSNYEYIKKEVR